MAAAIAPSFIDAIDTDGKNYFHTQQKSYYNFAWEEI